MEKAIEWNELHLAYSAVAGVDKEKRNEFKVNHRQLIRGRDSGGIKRPELEPGVNEAGEED